MPDSQTSLSGPALLALHGFSGGGADFDPLKSHLPSSLRWLCPDLPGHLSAHAQPCDPASVVEFIKRLAVTLPRPRWLLGYSMGARAALLHATSHPKCWDGLVLISARSGIPAAAERAERRRLDEERAQQIESGGLKTFLQNWQNQALIRSQQTIPGPIRAQMQITRSQHTVAGLATSLRQLGQGKCADVTDKLPLLKMPILLITGEHDLRYNEHAREIIACIPSAQHIAITNAGHMPHLENLAETAAAIRVAGF